MVIRTKPRLNFITLIDAVVCSPKGIFRGHEKGTPWIKLIIRNLKWYAYEEFTLLKTKTTRTRSYFI